MESRTTKEYRKEMWAAYYAQNSDKVREYHLKRKFGINAAQYDEMLKNQNDGCAICKRHKSDFKKRLMVDHCHTTKKVRGLLCYSCNQAIGFLKDSQERLRAAIEYLDAAQI